MRLIDADELKKLILEERDKIPFTVPAAPYELVKEKANTHGNAVRGGIRKALRCMEQTPTIEAEPVIRCKDCKHRGEPKECFMCFTAVEPVEGENMYRFHDLTTDNGYCNRGAKMDLEG